MTDIRSSINVMEQDDGNLGESVEEQGEIWWENGLEVDYGRSD